MTSTRNPSPQTYAFPLLRKPEDMRRAADLAREAQLQAALDDAIAKGLTEGIERGRVEAQTQAQRLLERAHREGLEQGRAQGLAEMRATADALREALAQLEIRRTQFNAEAEAFCVDLALAMLARLVEINSVRTEFVIRSIRSALKTLAPDNPGTIYVHPDIRKRVARALPQLQLVEDDGLAPGSARVEAGRMLVQSSIEEAFEQIRSAILEVKANRQQVSEGSEQGGVDASN